MRRSVFTAEHDAFRKTDRDFIAKEVVPHRAEWDRLGYVPHDFHARLGDLGVTGFDIPECYSGPGQTKYKYQAVRDGDHYVVSGSKTLHHRRLPGRSDDRRRTDRTAPAGRSAHRVSLLVIDTRSDGFHVGRRLEKTGLKISDTCEVSLSDVRVPGANLLGDEGRAFGYLGRNLPRERLATEVEGYATAAAAVECTTSYVRERTVFGKPVADFQNTKFVLAECATEVTAAQSRVDRALDLEETGQLSAADAAQCKLFCTEVAGCVIDKCLQPRGGYRPVLEYPIARLYADTRVSRIYGGTSEVLKAIVAKWLGL